MRQSKLKSQPATEAKLDAIYNSIDLLSTPNCFPSSVFYLYKDGRRKKEQFVDATLESLNKTALALGLPDKSFIDSNVPLTIAARDYDMIYSWISRTTIYQKNTTWWKRGIRGESDIIAMIDDIYVESLGGCKDLLAQGDKAAVQMVGLGMKNVVDFRAIRARNEANYTHQKECELLESGGFLKEAQ